MKTKIKIDTKGTVTFIYADALSSLIKTGISKIERVSNVEPCDGGWEARMHSGEILGPFPLRSLALSAEVKLLEKQLFSNQKEKQ